MTTIGGPGGIGGIGGPKGPGGPDHAEPESAASATIDDISGEVATQPARTVAESTIETLAGEIAAGRLTPREVTRELLDRLVEATGGKLDAAQRTELRELLTDLVTNDPYLGGLVGRI